MNGRAPRLPIPLDVLLAVPLLIIAAAIGLVILGLGARLTPHELARALSEPETLFALRLSFSTSLISLALSLLLGVPAAYLLARRRFRGMALVDTLLDLPLVMPPLVAGLGLLFVIGRASPLPPLAEIGAVFLFSPAGIVLAQTFIATTIIVRSAKAAFEAVDPGYRDVAGTLGLRPARVFFAIDLPLAAGGIVSGAILAWARALGEFGATLMVAGATRFRTETLPMAIYLNMATGEVEVAVACALVLLVTAFALLLMMRGLKRA
ncbi:ABC transporter permease [Afifella sp. H1R]|uniref:ABC transporter permease n=1 Tax=unclassified Afifella TaxID=2624128 RepID=UPI001F39E5B8|nr:ABC transporter permease [Afifella sp. H1R]MCF1503701.1 ABC transporter permease [Afifella sp. H1R]